METIEQIIEDFEKELTVESIDSDDRWLSGSSGQRVIDPYLLSEVEEFIKRKFKKLKK